MACGFLHHQMLNFSRFGAQIYLLSAQKRLASPTVKNSYRVFPHTRTQKTLNRRTTLYIVSTISKECLTIDHTWIICVCRKWTVWNPETDVQLRWCLLQTFILTALSFCVSYILPSNINQERAISSEIICLPFSLIESFKKRIIKKKSKSQQCRFPWWSFCLEGNEMEPEHQSSPSLLARPPGCHL